MRLKVDGFSFSIQPSAVEGPISCREKVTGVHIMVVAYICGLYMAYGRMIKVSSGTKFLLTQVVSYF